MVVPAGSSLLDGLRRMEPDLGFRVEYLVPRGEMSLRNGSSKHGNHQKKLVIVKWKCNPGDPSLQICNPGDPSLQIILT